MATAPSVIDVAALLDRGFGRRQIGVFLLCACAALLDGIDVQSVGPTVPSLAAALHTPISSFGAIFGITQVGFLLGALSFGPLADVVGRKWPLVGAMAGFAGFMIITPWADSLALLFAIRFCTGLGLGGMSVCAVALTSEYAPRHARARLVSALWAAFPLGGALAAFAASAIIPAWGWQWVYVIAGILSLIYALVLVPVLPESPKFLVAHNADPKLIRRVVEKIAPNESYREDSRYTIDEERLPGVPIKHLFAEQRAAMTFCVWAASFVAWLVLIVEGSWLPVLMHQAGYTISDGSIILGFNSAGATLGMLGAGFFIDRRGPYFVLMWSFLIGGACLATIGLYSSAFGYTLVVSAIAGIFTGTAGSGMIAVSAMVYPVAMRSTGVGWALGIGRIGAVIGPIAAGNLMALHFPPGQILVALAVPCALAAAIMPVLKRHAARRMPTAQDGATLSLGLGH